MQRQQKQSEENAGNSRQENSHWHRKFWKEKFATIYMQQFLGKVRSQIVPAKQRIRIRTE